MAEEKKRQDDERMTENFYYQDNLKILQLINKFIAKHRGLTNPATCVAGGGSDSYRTWAVDLSAFDLREEAKLTTCYLILRDGWACEANVAMGALG